MRWPRTLPAHEVIEGTLVDRYLFRFPEGSAARMAKALAFGPVTLAQVVALLRRRRAELVHVQCVSTGAAYAGAAARLLRLPLVVTLQGELSMDANDVYAHSAPLRATLRWLLRTADLVTACSADTLHEAEEWSGMQLGTRGRVIPNGIRLADFEDVTPWQHPHPYVVALGRLAPQKGFDTLIEAFAFLAPDIDVDLLIAGDGAERDRLLQQIDHLGLGGRVQLLGAADRKQVAALLAGARAFVLPSRHEPFGIVNLEAMASGCPVLATSVGGVPEIITDGVDGLLVPPTDAAAMAASLGRILNDAVLARQLAAAARARAAAFDWTTVTDQYLEAYAAAATNRAQPRSK